MAEKFGIINESGTYLEVDDDTFGPYKAAGYRKLKAGEPIPLQVFEEEDAGGVAAAANLVDPPSESAVKKARRGQAKDDGA